jgi:hypothetical protein
MISAVKCEDNIFNGDKYRYKKSGYVGRYFGPYRAIGQYASSGSTGEFNIFMPVKAVEPGRSQCGSSHLPARPK